MSAPYVIVRNDGAYVAPSGSARSYTRKLEEARRFPTREAAERDRCPGNEYVASYLDAPTAAPPPCTREPHPHVAAAISPAPAGRVRGRRPGYREMVAYIALNFDSDIETVDDLESAIVVDVIAEAFGKSNREVAEAVVKVRLAERGAS